MWFFYWVQEVFSGSVALPPIILIASGLLVFAAIAGYIFKDKSIFLALVCVIVGGTGIAATAANLSYDSSVLCWGGLAIVGGVCFLSLIAATYLRERAKARKQIRADISKKLQYTLPDRDNAYVRERLHTALQCRKSSVSDNMDEGDFLPEGEGQNDVLRLEHVRKLLNELKNAPLTKGERLEADEMTKLFAAYLKKSKWTSSDVRAVNELFAALLKMAAKYSV